MNCKVEFFVVVVFLWSNRAIVKINVHREAARNPQMAPWEWGEGRKKISSPNVLRETIFLFKLLAGL